MTTVQRRIVEEQVSFEQIVLSPALKEKTDCTLKVDERERAECSKRENEKKGTLI